MKRETKGFQWRLTWPSHDQTQLPLNPMNRSQGDEPRETGGSEEGTSGIASKSSLHESLGYYTVDHPNR